MKFLLVAVNAKYIHSNPAIRSLRAYAGKDLEKYVELGEYTINQYGSEILADIYKRKPEVIGFSCYIWNWELIQELICELPKILPETDIWLGGPEVTYHAEKLLKQYPGIKGVMIGEGEATFKEVLTQYVLTGGRKLSDEELEKIPGLCLNSGYTKMRELTDLSDLPFLYDNLDEFENKIIYYESSRGCPYSCSYCLSSIDKKVRLRDIGVVKKELQFFLDNKVKQVKFIDRTFNCNHEHAKAIWQYILENDNCVTNFHFEISADILRDDEIEILSKFRPGLAQLEIGVQSTNPKTIKAINRVMDIDKLEKIVAQIRANNNIHQHLDLIAGLPYEDYESFGQSFNRVYSMKPQQLQLGFLKVLKGSEMEDKAESFGILYLSKPPYEVLSTDWLSYDDICRLKRIEEMVELYYNSNQFTHTLPFLERAFESPFVMYEKMSEYFEAKNYFVNSPARAFRYEILLDFALCHDGSNAKIYEELLTFDIYLRENMKSRPSFALPLNDDSTKEVIRSFYKNEETARVYLTDYLDYDWKQLSKMTHLEPFKFPVWDEQALIRISEGSAEETEISENENYILFDYKNRNPLNYEAKTWVVKSI